VTLPRRRRAARRRPNNARRSSGRSSPIHERAGERSQRLAQFRANLGAILSQLRATAPRTRIVIGTYDNGYRDCICPQPPSAKTQAIVAGYLEGGGPFGVGLNNVIRQVAAANGVSVARSRICSVPEIGPPTASIRATQVTGRSHKPSSRLREEARETLVHAFAFD
jgi:hypothetical protein